MHSPRNTRAQTEGGKRTDGRTGGRRADSGRTGGRQGQFERQYNDFHRFSQKNKKTLCFSVVSHPADAQVPIFIAQMKKASKTYQTNTVFFEFSNHARAQVPIFTPKMKHLGRGRRATGSSGSGGSATRSVVHNPRNTRARGQDDCSSKQTPSNQTKYPQLIQKDAFLDCLTWLKCST